MKKSFDRIGKNRETQYPPTQREVMPMVLPTGNGATCETRTHDLLITSQLLYQLS